MIPAPTPALTQLPAYVFAALDELKAAARARGRAYVDLGIGSPDQPTPPGVVAALRAYTGRLVGAGIPGDLLYADGEVRRWTDAAGAEYREIPSVTGHDAFLIEHARVSALVAEMLAEG